jgi:tetratricopeptide (TPR) repeat protein
MDKAFDYFVRGWSFYLYFRRDANAEARRMYEEAIKLQPDVPRYHADLAYSLLHAWVFNWDDKVTMAQAASAADRAMALDAKDYYSNWVRGAVYLYEKDHANAETCYDTALRLAAVQAIPEDTRGLRVDWAEMLTLTGRAGRAVTEIKDVLNNSRVPERWFHWVHAWALYEEGRYQESIDALAPIGTPRNAMRKNLIANCVALNQLAEAQKHADLFVKEEARQGTTYAPKGQLVFPGLEKIEDRLPFHDPKRLQRWKDHLAPAFQHTIQP